jgi:hypothetical protein
MVEELRRRTRVSSSISTSGAAHLRHVPQNDCKDVFGLTAGAGARAASGRYVSVQGDETLGSATVPQRPSRFRAPLPDLGDHLVSERDRVPLVHYNRRMDRADTTGLPLAEADPRAEPWVFCNYSSTVRQVSRARACTPTRCAYWGRWLVHEAPGPRRMDARWRAGAERLPSWFG